MGAALHLSTVPEPPRTKRGGGGGPEGYIDTVRRIYEDPRADHEAKELLLAVAYAVGIAPPREDGGGPLRIAGKVLGRDRYRHPRIASLIAADAPRYVLPQSARNWNPSNAPGCEAPRLRPYKPRAPRPEAQPMDLLGYEAPTPIRRPHADLPPDIATMADALKAQMVGHVPPPDPRNEHMICGADGHHKVLERDPRTGWVIPHWFCRRHRDHAERVAGQVRAQNEAAPEPIPNAGGLLPCYFEADWQMIYEHYAPHWKPPVYGLRADDWPVPGRDAGLPSRPRLRLVLGGGDLSSPDGA